MAGICWMVQGFVYPSFHDVPDDQWAGHHRRHCFLIGLVVIPPMLAGFGASLFCLVQPFGLGLKLAAACFILSFVWTFARPAPLHSRLATGKDFEVIDQLIRANLPRTVLWTAAGLLCLLPPLAL
jgi:hypothetical protein